MAAGRGDESSNAASGTRARTASSAPLSEPAWVASTPSVRAPQLASPASAVVRPRPMPVVPAPCRATPRSWPSESSMRLSCPSRAPMTRSSGAPSTRSTTLAVRSPRTVACRDSSRPARRPVNQGTAVADRTRATSRTRPACGRNHQRAATVPAPTNTATRNGCSTRSTTSCSESTSSTKRATRSPLRKTGRPAGATASSRSNTRTRTSASTRSAASWPLSRSP